MSAEDPDGLLAATWDATLASFQLAMCDGCPAAFVDLAELTPSPTRSMIE